MLDRVVWHTLQKRAGLSESGHLLDSLCFYNYGSKDALDQFLYTYARKRIADERDLLRVKFSLIRYLKYQALFQCDADCSEEVRFLFSKCMHLLTVEDATQLNVILPVLGQNDLAIAVRDRLLPPVSETVNSKFQQEVFQTLRQIEGLFARYNCDEQRVEKDIVVEQWLGRRLEKPLVIEVNGVYHYCRNSEQALGKDVLKQKVLERFGYKCLTVPYYEWTILEHQSRVAYLMELIQNQL